MNYITVKESEKAERARKFISDYGGWNISGSGWSSETWKLLPNLVKIHRNLHIYPLFFISVTEDIKNSTRHQIVVGLFNCNQFLIVISLLFHIGRMAEALVPYIYTYR